MVWPALIGAAAGIAGGIISSKGQAAANKQNIALAREQMKFQERMSSTAYQRAGSDLSAAGLNRILALGSPASSPGGARANVLNEGAPMAEGLQDAASTALQVRKQNAELKLMYSQEGLLNQQEYAAQQAGDLSNRQREQIDTVQKQLEAQIRNLHATTLQTNANTRITNVEADMYQMIGPALLSVQKMLPTGSAAALGLGAIIKGFTKKKGGPRALTVPKDKTK